MDAITADYSDQILDYLLGGGLPPAISAAYLDIYNGDPQNGGTSILSTLTGSATRSSITASMGAASGRVATNIAAIVVTSNAPAGAFADYVAIFDAATSGNLIMSQQLTNPQEVTLGNGFQFSVGQLSFQLF